MSLNPLDWYKDIKALLAIKREATTLMDTLTNPTKPGWKTSEFWLNIVGIGATVISAVSGLVPAAAAPWLITATAVATTVYTVARTIAKATSTPVDDAFLDALTAKLKGLIDLNTPKVP